jgi:FMN-dependent NADH-azoreductase
MIMKTILVLNTSPRTERSQSRRLTSVFLKKWQEHFPGDKIIFRELGTTDIPHISEKWIAAAFSAPDKHTPHIKEILSLSDKLVEEFLAADIYVVGVPMFNWSIPSGFKAYIDHIMRINRTWKFASGKPDGNYEGLVKGKKMYLISTRGDFGYQKGEHNNHMNFQTPYIRTVFGIMGVTDITEIVLENEEYGGVTFQKSIEKTEAEIELLFDSFRKGKAVKIINHV